MPSWRLSNVSKSAHAETHIQRPRFRASRAVIACVIAAAVALVLAPRPAEAIPESTVSTVSPSGTTINLFDYWTTSDKSNSVSDTATDGINNGHQLKFNGGGGAGINKWTGSAAPMSYVSSTLVNGYPQISAGYHGKDWWSGTNYSAESLAYLFDSSTQPGKEAHLGVSGLLQAIDGYYEYDSTRNFASYDAKTNSFKVYDQPAVSYNGTSGMFFPFNSASEVSLGTNAAETNVLNHHFGLSMSTQFIQPSEGGTPGVTAYNGHNRDMEFEFSGDDDVWVYIDDVLVGDLGGIHDAAKLNINFRTGDVSVNGSSKGTLKSLFAAAGKSTDDFSGDTFKGDSQHTLKFYYLERGAYASNMHLKFNLVTKPISELDKVDQNGNPVQGAEFNLYEAGEDYTKKGEPIATGTTDANGQLVFTSVTDHSVISFDDEAKKGVTHFVLEEGNVPEGYRTSLMAVDDTMRLEYVKPQYSSGSTGESLGGALVSPDEVRDGASYDRMWLNGGYVATKETITAPGELNVIDTDKGKNITPSTQHGVMFAVTFMRGDDGTWKPIVGDAVNGYEPVDDTGISGVVEAAQKQGGSTFALTASGQYQVELSDLPGDIREYAYMRPNEDMSGARYVVAVYYTTASSLSGVTSSNTVRLDTHNFTRQFASKLLVTNVQNRLFVQKVDEGGNPVDGATFSLYSADAVEKSDDGTYRLKDGAEAIDTATTASRTFPYELDGSACFPVDSTNKTPLKEGTYYLAETAAPDGYLANDTVTKVIVDDSGVYVDAGKVGDGVRSMSGPGSLLSTLSQYGTNDEVDQTLAHIKGTLESATEGRPNLLWGDCTAQGVSPDVSDDNPMRMTLGSSASAAGSVLQYVTEGGRLPIIYADTGIDRMRIQQDGKPSVGDDLGNLQLNQLFTTASGVEYTDKRIARLEVTKQVTSADGTVAPTTYVDENGQTQDLTFEFRFNLPTNGILGSDVGDTQEYDAQVFDASGNAVGSTFKLRDGDTHAIKAGETIRVYGLAANDKFTVTETGKHENLGFRLVSRMQGNAQVEGEGDAISGTILSTGADGSVPQNNRLTFTNRYEPAPATLADGSFSAKKTLSGRAWADDDSFTIRLKAAVGTPMPAGATTDEQGDHTLVDRTLTKADLATGGGDTTRAVGFGDIAYTRPGTYVYTINELIPTTRADGMTYSNAEYRLTVTVTDDGAGRLHATPVLEQRSEDPGDGRDPADAPSYTPVDDMTASFTNAYNETEQSITFEATKTLDDTSGAHPLADGQFTFALEALGGFDDASVAQPLQGAYTVAATDVPMPQGISATTMTTTNNSSGVVSFPSITFTVAHDANRCYVYRVSERNTRAAGVTYDATEYYYVVRVAQTGAGINTTREAYKADGTQLSERPHFDNSYAVQPVSAGPITVQKTLDGRAWGDGEQFAFTLESHDDATAAAVASGAVTGASEGEMLSIGRPGDANGPVTVARGSFSATDANGTLTFTRPGTYAFDVSERAGDAGNVTYDGHVSTVTFTVTDTGEAEVEGGPSKLAVSVAYDNSAATTAADRAVTDAAAFTNTYRASVSYAGINVTKTMLGRDLAGSDVRAHIAGITLDGHTASTVMSTNLTCPDAEQGATVLLSDANGSTGLLSGTLTQAQAGNTYAFRVWEENSGQTISGTSYDTTNTGAALVTLYVGVDGSGSLYTVTSVYKGAAVDTLLATHGDALTSDDVASLGAPLQTVDSRTPDADEDGGDAPSTHATTGNDMPTVSFTNSYAATLDYAAAGGLDVVKTLGQQGGTGSPSRSFGFLVKAQDGYVTGQGGPQLVTTRQAAANKLGIGADNGQVFSTGEMGYGSRDVSLLPGGALTFTQDDAGNVYTYTVSEVKPDPVPAGYTYDETTYTVTIAVDDNGDGTLSATTTVTRPGDDGSTVTVSQKTCTSSSADGEAKTTIPFANEYKVDESGYATYTPQVRKVVSGKDATEQFRFVLSAADDATKAAVKDGTVSADGLSDSSASELDASTSGTIVRGQAQTVSFPQLTYSSVGTYCFDVREEAPMAPSGWHYDDHVLHITVNVYDNGGRLEARPTTSTDAGGATFSNTYEASTTLGAQGGIDVVKTLSGRTLREGQFSFSAEGANDNARAKIAELQDATDGRVTIKNDDPDTDADGTRASRTNILDDIEFTSDDAEKEFQFRIWENDDSQRGYTYDSSYYVVTVTPRLTGDGSALYIDASTQRYDENDNAQGDPVVVSSKDGNKPNIECAFANSYAATGTLTNVSATKTLTGRDMAAGEFKFDVELVRNDGSTVVVNQGTNEAASDGQPGRVDVPAITFAMGKHDDASGVVDLLRCADEGLCQKVFNDDGTATYTFECALVEDVDSLPDGVRPTTGTQPRRRFKIVVTDNGDGTLTPRVAYNTGDGSGSLDFYNTYDKVKTIGTADQPGVDIDGQLLSVGASYTYTIRWVNNATDADGHSCAADVSITDELPAGLEFVSASDGGALGADDRTVSWTLANRAANTNGSVTVTVRVTSDALKGAKADESNVATIENTATIKVGDRAGYTSAPVTNYVPEKSVVDGSGSAAGTAQVGEELTYAVGWRNTEDNATDVTIRDTLPDNTEYVDGSAGDGASYDASTRTVTWTLKGRQPGEEGTVSLRVRVLPGATGSTLANEATVRPGDAPEVTTNRTSTRVGAGSLLVTKRVTADASLSSVKGRLFSFKVSLRDAAGKALPGSYACSGTYNGGKSAEGFQVFDGKTLSLGDGDRLLVSNLPAGATYTVEETAADGYETTANGEAGRTATGTIPSGSQVSADFVNAYGAAGTFDGATNLRVTKRLVDENGNDADWNDGDAFAFTMAPGDDATSAAVDAGSIVLPDNASGLTISSDTDGHAASFGDVTFKAAGEFDLAVSERRDGALPDVIYDKGVRHVRVRVTDGGGGALAVSVERGSDALVFENVRKTPKLDYGAAGGLTLEKTLVGRAMTVGQFEFTLRAVDADGTASASDAAALLGIPEGGRVFASPAADAGAAAPVNLIPDGLVLTRENAGKTYAYELTETKGGGAGYTNDAKVHEIRIAVANNGDGTLTATTTVDGTPYTYKTGDAPAASAAKVSLTNTYKASDATAQIAAKKVLSGRDQVAGEFHFSVTDDATGEVVATGTNGADGTITFDNPLSYTQADAGKTFAYTVTETGDMPSGVTGVVTQLHVTVAVTDNGDGTLTASVTYPDGADHLTFENAYGADATATVSMNGTKEYDVPTGEGYHAPDIEGKFAFTLTGEEGAPMPAGSDGRTKVVRNAGGNVDFGTIGYTMADAGKEYTYTVTEAATDDSPAGVSIDGGKKTVLVRVTDNGDGTISATAVDGDGTDLGTGSKFSFTNAYAVSPASATISGAKTLTGRDLREGEFAFELLDEARNRVATATNAADGSFSFGLDYDKPGEHNYTVREVNDGAAGVTYDAREFAIHVSVTDDGAGALEATVTYPDGDVAFENRYDAGGETPSTPNTPDTPSTPDSGGGETPGTPGDGGDTTDASSSGAGTAPAGELPQTGDPLAGPGVEAGIAVAGVAVIVAAVLLRRRR